MTHDGSNAHALAGWRPRLRLTHCRGQASDRLLDLPANGQGLSQALAFDDDRATDLRLRRSADKCRIEPANADGGWQLVNDSAMLVCALNGRRIARGHVAAIALGDELELGLLRFVIEACGGQVPGEVAGQVPRTIATPAAAAAAQAAETSLFDLQDLAHARDPDASSWSRPDEALGIPGFTLAADAPAPRLIDDLVEGAPVAEEEREPASSLPDADLLATRATHAASAASTGLAANSPEGRVMQQLHEEFERAVRAPSELRTRADWASALDAADGETAPDLDQLKQAGSEFELVRDVLETRSSIDQAIDSIDALGAGGLPEIQDAEVLSLFAPEIAASAARSMPDLTRREHHALSPDSPVRIGHVKRQEHEP